MKVRAWATLALDVPRRLVRARILIGMLLLLSMFMAAMVGGLEVQTRPLPSSGGTVLVWGNEAHSATVGPASQVLLEYLCYVVLSFGGVAIAGSTLLILTNDAIPRAFLPGAAEVTLTKPLGRWEVVLARALGAFLVAAGVEIALVGGSAAIAAARTGLPTGRLLLSLPGLCLAFAVLHGLASLMGVIVRNPQWGILGTFGGLMVSLILWGSHYFLTNFDPTGRGDRMSPTFELTARVLRYGLPRPAELIALAYRMAIRQPFDTRGDLFILANGVAWTAGLYLLVVLAVRKRDY